MGDKKSKSKLTQGQRKYVRRKGKVVHEILKEQE